MSKKHEKEVDTTVLSDEEYMIFQQDEVEAWKMEANFSIKRIMVSPTEEKNATGQWLFKIRFFYATGAVLGSTRYTMAELAKNGVVIYLVREDIIRQAKAKQNGKEKENA